MSASLDIPGAEGARKIRWTRPGTGKSGGARVIYFNLTDQQTILLIAAYAKADRATMNPAEIKKERSKKYYSNYRKLEPFRYSPINEFNLRAMVKFIHNVLIMSCQRMRIAELARRKLR